MNQSSTADAMSSSPDQSSVCACIRWWGPVGLMLSINQVSGGQPMPIPGLDFFSADKLIHFLVFGLLATAIFRVLPKVWKDSTRSVLAISLTAVFGLYDELHQSYTPGRFMEIDDWIADVSGAIVAVYVYRFWPRYRKLLELRMCAKKPLPAAS